MKQTSKSTISNRVMLWATIFASMIVVVTLVSVVAIVHFKTKNAAEEVSGKAFAITPSTTTENVIEMNTLTKVENATEQELKKINEKEVKEAEKKETVKKQTTGVKKKYYIKVNYNAQVVNVYTYDKQGNYTIPVKAFVCSTGTETPTSGVFTIPAQITWCHMFGDVWAHYCTQIVGNILFHSVPYLERNNYTLEYWAYDKLGTKASMGCVRLTTKDAKWIYDNVSVGTKVEFYASSNPGPLGKPTAQKISNAPETLRGWDPTDPDIKNPWHSYHPEVEKQNTSQIQPKSNTIISNETSLQNQENTIQTNTEVNNETQNNQTIKNIEQENTEQTSTNESQNIVQQENIIVQNLSNHQQMNETNIEQTITLPNETSN